MEQIKEYSPYKSLNQWCEVDPKGYGAAKRTNSLEEICDLHGWIKPKKKKLKTLIHWDEQSCIIEARKHKNVTEWKNNSYYSYKVAEKNKWLIKCYEHMKLRKQNGYWNNKQNCINEARKYKSITEWAKKSVGSYAIALKNNWKDECIEHMKILKKPDAYWNNKQNCINEARKYKTKTEWKENSPGSHAVAVKNNWKDECTEHMIPTPPTEKIILEKIKNELKEDDKIFKTKDMTETLNIPSSTFRNILDKLIIMGYVLNIGKNKKKRNRVSINKKKLGR